MNRTPPTLLEELATIDAALLDDDATDQQEKRGQELLALANAAPAMLLSLEAAEDAIEEATDIMLYEDCEPVTFLESWEIERAYGALVSVLVQVHEAVSQARISASPGADAALRVRHAAPSMLTALKFALPFTEDLANSSDNKGERRAARLMRAAIAAAEGGAP